MLSLGIISKMDGVVKTTFSLTNTGSKKLMDFMRASTFPGKLIFLLQLYGQRLPWLSEIDG